MLPFVIIGGATTLYVLWGLAAYPTDIYVGQQHFYTNPATGNLAVGVLYIIATCGSLFFSKIRILVNFGAVKLAILLLVDAIKAYAFTSVWCAYAAVASVIVLVYFWRSSKQRPFLYASFRIGPVLSDAATRPCATLTSSPFPLDHSFVLILSRIAVSKRSWQINHLILLGAACLALHVHAQNSAPPISVTVIVANAITQPPQPVKAAHVSLTHLINPQLAVDAQGPTNPRGETQLLISQSAARNGDLRIVISGTSNLVIYGLPTDNYGPQISSQGRSASHGIARAAGTCADSGLSPPAAPPGEQPAKAGQCAKDRAAQGRAPTITGPWPILPRRRDFPTTRSISKSRSGHRASGSRLPRPRGGEKSPGRVRAQGLRRRRRGLQASRRRHA